MRVAFQYAALLIGLYTGNAFIHTQPRFTPLLGRRTSLLATITISDETALLKDTEVRMAKSLDSLSKSLSSVRAGRPQPSMLDRIVIDYFSKPTPIKNVASIQVTSASTITVQVHDMSLTKDVSKAIMDSDLGIIPAVVDDKTIRLNIPPMTEERRKDLVKSVKAFGEEAKVSLRNNRRDSVDMLKKMMKSKEYEIGKDQEKKTLNSIQKITDNYVKQIDSAVDKKAKDVMKL